MWYLLILVAAIAPPLVTTLAPSGLGDGARAAAGAAVAIFIVVILAGLVEEPGWRGCALDRLQTLYSALGASLVLGGIWALWHLPLFNIEGTYLRTRSVRAVGSSGCSSSLFFLRR